jgi:hypothetical protein
VTVMHKITQSMNEFSWTGQKEKAAVLLAQNDKTDEVIAKDVGVSLSALAKWKVFPQFSERVKSLTGDIRRAVRSHGISVIENRVIGLQRRRDKMLKIIEERGESPEMQDVPGGKSGMLVHNVKSVGSGAEAERVDLYEFDASLLKELREHEKQAAQELGQWEDKINLEAKVETTHAFAIARDDSERAEAVDEIIARRAEAVSAN